MCLQQFWLIAVQISYYHHAHQKKHSAKKKKKKAKHVAVIPMGEKEAEEKNSFSGYSGLLTSWRTLLKEEVSLVILWHLIIVSVY